jgi:hypothetical protein
LGLERVPPTSDVRTIHSFEERKPLENEARRQEI